MAYTFNYVLALGASNTGLTLAASLKNGDGTAASGTMTTTYLAEKGSGLGLYYFQAQMPDDHTGYVQIADGATVKMVLPVTPTGSIQNLDQQITEAVDEIEASVNVQIGVAVVEANGTLPSTSGRITRRRGDSWTIAFTGLGSLTGRTKLWFSIKDDATNKTDAQAMVQVTEGGGLIYLNGAAGTSNQGSITVSDATTGAITVAVDEVATAALTPGTHYRYDVQVLTGGTVTTLDEGVFIVTADVTRATS